MRPDGASSCSRGAAASGTHDQCGWIVEDIESEVTELRSRAVAFEEFAGATFVNGIRDDPAGRSAWFRDSEGNLLNVRSNELRKELAGRS